MPLQQAPRLTVLNDLAECTTFKLDGLFALGDVVVGRFAVRSLKSRGECGCMSSEVAYRVVEAFDAPEEAIAAGAAGEYEHVYASIAPRDDGKPIWLVASTDLRHFHERAWTLKLHCKGPD